MMVVMSQLLLQSQICYRFGYLRKDVIELLHHLSVDCTFTLYSLEALQQLEST